MRSMRMNSVKYSCLCVAITLQLVSVLAAGQSTADVEQGMKPYGSYQEGNVDAVSFTNGGLVINIPIVSFPQRGSKLKAEYWLDFHNTSMTMNQYCAPYVGCKYFSTFGYGGGTPFLNGTNQGDGVGLEQYLDSNGVPTSIYYATVGDAHGGSHQLAWTGGTSYESIDATALHYDSSMQILTYKDGTREYFTGGGVGVAGKPVKIEDANGNMMTTTAINQYSWSWTDTMGRVLPLPVATTDYTGCTGPLPTTSAETLAVPDANGGTAQYKLCFASPSFSFKLAGIGDPYGNPVSGTNINTIQSVVLPNNTTWTFKYETTYAALSSITLPTGGTISYTWYAPVTLCGNPGYPKNYALQVKTRTINANDGTGLHTWTYAWPSQYTSGSGTVTVTDPLGNDTLHGMTGLGGTCAIYETTAQYYQGSSTSGTLLKKVQTDYTYTAQNPNNHNTLIYNTAVNVVPIRVTTTWPATNQITKVETDYDSGFSYTGNVASGTATYGRVTAKREYDFGSGAPGPLLRSTVTSYVSSAPYTTNHMLSLVSSTRTNNGAGAQQAYTYYGYDEYSLASSGITTQHDSAPPFGTARGNQSSVHRWLNGSSISTTACPVQITNGYTVTSATYYDTGVVSQSTDSCRNSTSFSYSSSYLGAYITQSTNALHQVTSHTYDLNSGLLASTTDPNNLTTTYVYDSMWRPSRITLPDGGTEGLNHQEASLPFSVTLTKTINSGQSKVTTNVFDGLGRLSQSQLSSDPQGTVFTDTSYDALGHIRTVSNPYRSGSDPTTSSGTTTYAYDALGRKTSETYADAAVLKTAYCGPNTLVTDPTGRWRRSRTDGIGRLAEVDEPNALGASVNANGCPGTAEPIWITSYSYDTLGDLTSVLQNSSRQRTFTYDSQSHLLTAANPENGTVKYGYDANANLITKTDARSIVVTYGYDVLNRPTSRSYSNGDAAVTIRYDEANCLGLSSCANVGQRTSLVDGAGSEAWSYQVDSTNHRSVKVDQRTTASGTGNIAKKSTYYLDMAGNVTSVVYPTGRTVNYAFDSADRPATAIDSSSGITYATDAKSPATGCRPNLVCYTPQGTFYALSIGQSSSFNGLNVSHTYNNRLQPYRFSASSTAGTAIDITYSFVDGTTHTNAGHVANITNNLDSTRSQGFAYDQVNRLTEAGTVVDTGSHCWGYLYSYDAWGNLLAQAGWTQYYGTCTESVMGGVTSDTHNHISGLSYDPSGNTLGDGSYSYSWNGESQLKTAAGVTYSYDADGRRVAKVGSKLYWYGAGGEILAETDAAGGTLAEYVYFSGTRVAVVLPTGGPQLYAEDFLGSSRIITNASGVACYDADFTPFGGERAYTSSCASNVYKFEGKERDNETGNDDFGARYYSWRFGRWLSADWSAAPVPVPYANLSNPQSLNLYAMVSDDPESFADLDGHCWPPSECAHAVMDKVNQAQKWVEDKSIATGSPTLAAVATFTSGATRDVINGFVGMATVGEASGAAWDSGNTTQRVLAAVEDGGKAGGIALLGASLVGSPTPAPEGDLLKPGPYAGESTPASGPRITSAEQAEVNRIGQETGCHSCGTMDPGTKSGNFVGDHQPVTALNRNAAPQRLYPQCLQCSRIQGGQTRAAQVAAAQQPPTPPKPVLPPPMNPQPGGGVNCSVSGSCPQ